MNDHEKLPPREPDIINDGSPLVFVIVYLVAAMAAADFLYELCQ